eukprot:766772-Hanusia_phi.AAC.7
MLPHANMQPALQLNVLEDQSSYEATSLPLQSVYKDDGGFSASAIDVSGNEVIAPHFPPYRPHQDLVPGGNLVLAENAEMAKQFEEAERLYLLVQDGWLRARDMWVRQENLSEAVRLMQQHLNDKQEREQMVKQFVLQIASNQLDTEKAVRTVETFVGPEDAVDFAVSRKSWAVAMEISKRSVPKLLFKVFVMQSKSFVETGNIQKAIDTLIRGNFHLVACQMLGILGRWEEASKLATKEAKRFGTISAREWVTRHSQENVSLRSVDEEILSMEDNEGIAVLLDVLREIIGQTEREEVRSTAAASQVSHESERHAHDKIEIARGGGRKLHVCKV